MLSKYVHFHYLRNLQVRSTIGFNGQLRSQRCSLSSVAEAVHVRYRQPVVYQFKCVCSIPSDTEVPSAGDANVVILCLIRLPRHHLLYGVLKLVKCETTEHRENKRRIATVCSSKSTVMLLQISPAHTYRYRNESVIRPVSSSYAGTVNVGLLPKAGWLLFSKRHYRNKMSGGDSAPQGRPRITKKWVLRRTAIRR